MDWDSWLKKTHSDPSKESDTDSLAPEDSDEYSTSNSGGTESESFNAIPKKVYVFGDCAMWDKVDPPSKEKKHRKKLFGLMKNSKNKYITTKNSDNTKNNNYTFGNEDYEMNSPLTLSSGKGSLGKISGQKSSSPLSRKARCKKRISSLVNSLAEKLKPKSRTT